MYGLRMFWKMSTAMAGIGSFLDVVTALAVIVITIRSPEEQGAPRREVRDLSPRAAALIDRHLTNYDLVMLMPALLLIGIDSALQNPTERDAARVLTYRPIIFPDLV